MKQLLFSMCFGSYIAYEMTLLFSLCLYLQSMLEKEVFFIFFFYLFFIFFLSFFLSFFIFFLIFFYIGSKGGGGKTTAKHAVRQLVFPWCARPIKKGLRFPNMKAKSQFTS